jgi:hypothetical protein
MGMVWNQASSHASRQGTKRHPDFQNKVEAEQNSGGSPVEELRWVSLGLNKKMPVSTTPADG